MLKNISSFKTVSWRNYKLENKYKQENEYLEMILCYARVYCIHALMQEGLDKLICLLSH